MSPIVRPDVTAETIGAARGYTYAYGQKGIRRETFPRDNIQAAQVITTSQRAILRRITLVPGSYTTISVWITTGSTPAGLSNCYFGIYDSAGTNGGPSARLAVSADLSADDTFAGDGTSHVATATLNYTCTTAGDYFIAALATFTTAPTWGRAAAGIVAVEFADPVTYTSTSASNLTALPDPIGTLVASTSSLLNFWFRYE